MNEPPHLRKPSHIGSHFVRSKSALHSIGTTDGGATTRVWVGVRVEKSSRAAAVQNDYPGRANRTARATDAFGKLVNQIIITHAKIIIILECTR